MSTQTIKIASVIFSAAISIALAGCAGHTTYQGGTARVANDGSLVTAPRINGTTTSQGTRANSSFTVGNRATPARVHINARSTTGGVDVSPSIRSRYINWSFR